MKKLLFITSLLALMGCKKDFAGWEDPIAIGTKFKYDYKQYGNRPWIGPAPRQPFTVDSIAHGEYGDQNQYNGYWVSNADGLSFTLPPVDIRPYIIH